MATMANDTSHSEYNNPTGANSSTEIPPFEQICNKYQHAKIIVKIIFRIDTAFMILTLKFTHKYKMVRVVDSYHFIQDKLLVYLAQFLVPLVAQFGVALGGDEEFFGLLGEGLHQRVVADLAHDGSCGS